MSDVYIVMIGNTVQSVLADQQDAEKMKAKFPGSKVTKSPVIQKMTGDLAGVTEGMEDAGEGDTDDNPLHAPEELDVIITDVPFMLRVMEWAREEAEADNDLHLLVEQMVEMSNAHDCVLTMEEYAELIVAIGGQSDEHHGDEDSAKLPVSAEPSDDEDESTMQESATLTFAQYAAKKDPANPVPTVSDMFKRKGRGKPAAEVQAKLIQDPVTTAFKISDTLAPVQ